MAMKRSVFRVRVVRLVVLALLASTVAVGEASGPALAVESPPAFTHAWGTNGSGPGQFSYPRGVAVDADGNVYVADTSNHRVEKFGSWGTYFAQWGGAGSGEGQFNFPVGVAVDADGNVYVADASNHRVQKFDSSGGFLTQWGTPGSGNGQFSDPYGVAVDADGNVYVADTSNHRVQKFDSSGSYLTQWGGQGSGNGQFAYPVGVAVDTNGNVYVADRDNHRVQKFDSSGAYLAQWGGLGSGDGQFDHPFGVAVDGGGHVFVADSVNHRVEKFDSSGAYLTQWGTNGSGNGQFNSPFGVAVNADGTVYVVDYGNHRVQRFGVPDVTDPTIDLVAPLEGAVYARAQVVPADFSCGDEVGGSGIALCEGTVADGQSVDTSTLGDHDFTVSAADVAGNTSEVTHTYTVGDARPDGRIKNGATGVYKGDGVYNTTGAGQTRRGSAARGHSVTYFVSVQNDAPFPDVLRLKGGGTTSAFTVRYTAAGADVTGRVMAGTYTTPTLAPGATHKIKVVVTVRQAAPVHAALTRTLKATSTTDTTRKDTVRFVTSRS